MSTKTNKDEWKARVLAGIAYAVALLVMVSGPLLFFGALGLALLAGDMALASVGLVSGAGLGLAGAAAMLWCLERSRAA